MEFDSNLYDPGNSTARCFDARIKIIFLFFVFIIIFLTDTWINIFICSLFSLFIVFLGRVPLRKLFSGIKTWFLIVVFICIFPSLVTEGRLFIRLGWISITYEGIRESGMLFAKLLLTSLNAKILTATTTIRQIILAFQYFSSPLKILGFSSEEMGFIVSAGTGFIHFFSKEARQITQAGTLRGIDWDVRRILNQPFKILFLIQAVITRMYTVGFQMEESLKIYGYNQCCNKTSFYELKYKAADWILVLGIVFLGAIVYYFN
ncbi:MAG: energy-coupling factor transporter transmembrane component T [bacterium]